MYIVYCILSLRIIYNGREKIYEPHNFNHPHISIITTEMIKARRLRSRSQQTFQRLNIIDSLGIVWNIKSKGEAATNQNGNHATMSMNVAIGSNTLPNDIFLRIILYHYPFRDTASFSSKRVVAFRLFFITTDLLKVQARPTTGIIIVEKDIITRPSGKLAFEWNPRTRQRGRQRQTGGLNHVWTERDEASNENSR